MRRRFLLLCTAAAAAVSRGRPLRPPAAASAAATETFWCCDSKEVPLHEAKRAYAKSRFSDKSSRTAARQRLRADGLVSNLYRLRLDPRAEVQTYDIAATRRLLPQSSPSRSPSSSSSSFSSSSSSSSFSSSSFSSSSSSSLVRRVDSTRAWRAVQRHLQRRFPAAPAHVCVRRTLYAAGPLPAAALALPRDAMDFGWAACRLRWAGRRAVAQLPAEEARELANKAVLWAMRAGGNARGGGFGVVREATGKLVGTDGGVKINGLRVFRGTVARVVFVDTAGAMDESEEASKTEEAVAMEAPASAVLSTLEAGPHAEPLQFLVREFVREFEYKGSTVQSYRIEDASGVIMASLWKPTKETTLNEGTVYETTDFRVRIFASRNDMRLVEMVVGEATITPIAKENDSVPGDSTADSLSVAKGRQEILSGSVAAAAQHSRKHAKKTGKNSEAKRASHGTAAEEANGVDASDGEGNKTTEKKMMHGELALKIDTKCTVAAEQSLWADVKQHFGSGPYDTAEEENITRALRGTPVITSHTIRHGIVRLLRFNVLPDAVELDPALRRRAHDIEPGQPFALMQDGALFPLQALHCCYDPRVRAWQDITVTACSLMPTERLAVLDAFRCALEDGLRHWGFTLAARPSASRELALLPAPQRMSSSFSSSSSSSSSSSRESSRALPPFPVFIGVVAIVGPHADEAERLRMSQTAQSLSTAFRSNAVATVADEKAAVSFVVERIAKESHAAVLFISADRESRPARWATAECLVRGVLPIFLPPCASPKRQALLAQNARLRMRNCFETNPSRGVEVAREVPAIAGRCVLIIGIDACHTTTFSTGCIVGVLCTPQRNHLIPVFWKHEARGQEVDQVAAHFGVIIARAAECCGEMDEIVVFQDGDVYSEVERMRTHVPENCGFTFMCLHKRTNIRFVHVPGEADQQTNNSNHNTKNNHYNNNNKNNSTSGTAPLVCKANNAVKGSVVQSLTPVAPDAREAAPSFFLQNHDCNMSTARTVQYTVHAKSPSLDVADVQQLSYVLSHVMATQSTKLPMPARCAHKLASVAERLFDAAPPLTCDMIPAPLNERLWFM